MEFFTKDSGERKSFDSGMNRDTDKTKPKFDLIIPKNRNMKILFCTDGLCYLKGVQISMVQETGN